MKSKCQVDGSLDNLHSDSITHPWHLKCRPPQKQHGRPSPVIVANKIKSTIELSHKTLNLRIQRQSIPTPQAARCRNNHEARVVITAI